MEDYAFKADKQPYLAFLGRMAPVKGPHLAIEVAKRAGLPLKLAGEVQPLFEDYWKTQVLPEIDGREIEFVGEASLDIKNELLGNASALLFPIQWNEPFGLVMIEAMACGTPVIALPGGAVPEVVRDGVSGWICRDVDEMAARAVDIGISPASCRDVRRARVLGRADGCGLRRAVPRVSRRAAARVQPRWRRPSIMIPDEAKDGIWVDDQYLHPRHERTRGRIGGPEVRGYVQRLRRLRRHRGVACR